jgi:hypothetical protein
VGSNIVLKTVLRNGDHDAICRAFEREIPQPIRWVASLGGSLSNQESSKYALLLIDDSETPPGTVLGLLEFEVVFAGAEHGQRVVDDSVSTIHIRFKKLSQSYVLANSDAAVLDASRVLVLGVEELAQQNQSLLRVIQITARPVAREFAMFYDLGYRDNNVLWVLPMPSPV